jgi:hypothetical protein
VPGLPPLVNFQKIDVLGKQLLDVKYHQSIPFQNMTEVERLSLGVSWSADARNAGARTYSGLFLGVEDHHQRRGALQTVVCAAPLMSGFDHLTLPL